MPTVTFAAGEDFVVPGGVFSVTIELEGTAGEVISEDSFSEVYQSGDGGRVKGDLNVQPGDTLHFRETSGGNSSGQRGGFAMDVRLNGTSLSDRVAVAAGGGGGAYIDDGATRSGTGGDGGPNIGQDAQSSYGNQATGGTQTEGGTGGSKSTTVSYPGKDGSFGVGGDAGDVGGRPNGGGGGAGWYGGGGGGTNANTQGPAGAFGGAGGSNYTGGLDTATANERGTSTRSYDEGGLAVIDYTQTTPENLQITDTTTTTNDLTWNPPSSLPTKIDSIEQYRIYRDTAPGDDRSDYVEVATVDASKTTYPDVGLDQGTTYHYRVGADLFEGVPDFQVTIDDAPSDAFDGGDVDVSFTVDNQGTGDGTQEVRVLVDGDQQNAESITLDPNVSTSRTETVSLPETGNPSSHTVRVETDGSFDETTVSTYTLDSAPGLIHTYPGDTGSGDVIDNTGSNDLSVNGLTWGTDSRLKGGYGLTGFNFSYSEAIGNSSEPYPATYVIRLIPQSVSGTHVAFQHGEAPLLTFDDSGHWDWRDGGSWRSAEDDLADAEDSLRTVICRINSSQKATNVFDGNGNEVANSAVVSESNVYESSQLILGRGTDGYEESWQGFIDPAMYIFDRYLSDSEVNEVAKRI